MRAPFDGLGGQVNYTYSSASNTALTNMLALEELPHPGLSNHDHSRIGCYDKGPLSARIACTRRSEYLLARSIRSTDISAPGKRFFWELSARY